MWKLPPAWWKLPPGWWHVPRAWGSLSRPCPPPPRAAGLAGLRSLAHPVRLDRERVRDVAVAQHFDRLAPGLLDETGLDEPVGVHDAAGREARGEILDVDHRELDLAAIGQEAALGQAPVEWHLAALEAGARAAARASLEPLVAPAGRLPAARGRPATATLPLFRRALRRPEIFESHDTFLETLVSPSAASRPVPGISLVSPAAVPRPSTLTAKGTASIMPRIGGGRCACRGAA